jgi:hypothetical protein
MADLSDVSAALRALISAALYPPAQFPSGPSGNSVAGLPVLVQSGWPDPKSLQAQIAAGKAQVTVYPQKTERNTTRYPQTVDQSGPLQAATFTMTSAGQVITIAGAQPSPTFYGQNFAAFVNSVAYIYRSLQSDTPDSIASALQALIVVDMPGTTVAGPQITLPALARIGPLRIGTQAPTLQELKRQERDCLLIVWAPTPSARDAVAKFIDVAIPQNKFLTLADTTSARLIYKGSPYSDFDQKQGIYRRDFIVSVEYATTAADTAPEAIAIKTVTSQEGADGSTISPPINTTYN